MSDHTIKVNIANRPYRLKIQSEEEEEIIRKSAEHIEKLINDYSGTFHYNDFQDLLAMISLQLANNSLSLQKQIDYRDNEMTSHLQEIDEFLSSKVS
ncbi:MULTISPECIES: cell division protein ZapA [unclassified Lentimicrobium]|uniref:cell division protein ZapA n=1 Tax=unclassified Lentimicrobium TaxID=2677434 RepID=UPI0015538E4D|nr:MULTISPECIES: cell division protein ZapA [unclassified Lentimicrobium]NPD47585.1 cell division protein ZapA [Lentimicrobium sp. S6]NPD83611.1 cell division protein ZapA [Lentimicrobium sp. L6]